MKEKSKGQQQKNANKFQLLHNILKSSIVKLYSRRKERNPKKREKP